MRLISLPPVLHSAGYPCQLVTQACILCLPWNCSGSKCAQADVTCCPARLARRSYHLFHFWQNIFNDDIQVLDVAQQGEWSGVTTCV